MEKKTRFVICGKVQTDAKRGDSVCYSGIGKKSISTSIINNYHNYNKLSIKNWTESVNRKGYAVHYNSEISHYHT